MLAAGPIRSRIAAISPIASARKNLFLTGVEPCGSTHVEVAVTSPDWAPAELCEAAGYLMALGAR
jgi:hypothetical protein